MTTYAAAILTGGLSLRMGKDKARIDFEGSPMLLSIAKALRCVFEDVRAVAKEPELYEGFGLPVVRDRLHKRCPLAGIHAALSEIDADKVFIVSCDAPRIHPDAVRCMLRHDHPNADVVVPIKDDWYYYPLFALYSKKCLPVIERLVAAREFQTIQIYPFVKTVGVDLMTLGEDDPDLESLINVNTPGDLKLIQKTSGSQVPTETLPKL